MPLLETTVEAAALTTAEYWGIDSEGLGHGLDLGIDDLHSIQVCSSKGEHTGHVFRNPQEFREWLRARHGEYRPTIFYAFTLPYEYGTLAAWELLKAQNENGKNPWQDWADAPINLFYIQPAKARIPVYDVRCLFGQLVNDKQPLSSLKRLGDYLSGYYNEDIHKYPAPLPEGEFGTRKPTEDEWPAFCRYGIRDAYICAKAGEWLQENVVTGWLKDAVPIEELYSWGTVAEHYLGLPRIGKVLYTNKRTKQLVIEYENKWYYRILDAVIAGRSEAFSTGNVGQVYYNDVSSLYPVAAIHSQAMRISDVNVWDEHELYPRLLGPITWKKFYEATGCPYGWILGDFSTKDDLWGLPVRRTEDTNVYLTCDDFKEQLYHTLDLEASNATVENIRLVLVPHFEVLENAFTTSMRRYEELTTQKLDHKYSTEMKKHAIKGTINANTGKLGQHEHGISRITNPPAYQTLLAESHLFMSRVFHRYHSPAHPIHYMDTDSFFWYEPVDEILEFLEPYPELPYQTPDLTVPLAVDVKGTSRPEGCVIFRGKMYYQAPDSLAYAGWKPYPKHFAEIVEGKLTCANVERQVSRKWRTRDKTVTVLKVGRWYIKKEYYSLEKLRFLFRADNKRRRENYDSYQIFLDGKEQSSRAWTLDEYYRNEPDAETKHGACGVTFESSVPRLNR